MPERGGLLNFEFVINVIITAKNPVLGCVLNTVINLQAP
jgi:hypothetical protein